MGSIIAPLVLAAVMPIAVALSNKWVNRISKARSLHRIENEPLYKAGAKIDTLFEIGVESPRMINATIIAIEFGRVVIEDTQGNQLPMTVQEFENMHAVMQAE